MKTNNFNRLLASLAFAAVLGFAATGVASAHDDHDSDHHNAWSHDHNGYWDNHGQRHAYIEHNHHHGFWRDGDNGARVFINID